MTYATDECHRMRTSEICTQGDTHRMVVPAPPVLAAFVLPGNCMRLFFPPGAAPATASPASAPVTLWRLSCVARVSSQSGKAAGGRADHKEEGGRTAVALQTRPTRPRTAAPTRVLPSLVLQLRAPRGVSPQGPAAAPAAAAGELPQPRHGPCQSAWHCGRRNMTSKLSVSSRRRNERQAQGQPPPRAHTHSFRCCASSVRRCAACSAPWSGHHVWSRVSKHGHTLVGDTQSCMASCAPWRA